MTETIRILIADDHAIVREGLRWLIDTEPGIELVNGRLGVRRREHTSYTYTLPARRGDISNPTPYNCLLLSSFPLSLPC